MNKPPSWTSREESLLLLNASLDNELDAASVLDVERRIASDATLKAEHERLLELRTALASHLSQGHASDALRKRIAAIAPTRRDTARLRPFPRRYEWQHMAAAVLIGACLAGGGTYLTMRHSSPTGEVAEIVAGHQRALLATAPYDVASTDRHTVKPWFDSKLALSPQVVDLSEAGFPLAGGRVDVIDGQPVPVMVYRRRAHVISVLAIPHLGDKDNDRPPTRATQDGYSVLRWQGADFDYAAVSDVAKEELEEFVSRWRSFAPTK